MGRLIFWLILRPIILRDYRLREEGKRPDQWHWADKLALSWGFVARPSTEGE